ncbi:hypothetical protein [Streptomyces erythrochromogenes]|uniref:hypothetical protein n=1 Tax=Streptomyces erythrochromogenes TaxID=285574 RepID=UPI00380C121E
MSDLTQSISEALDIADQRHWTKNPPRSHTDRLDYLIAQLGTRQAAARLQLQEPLVGAGPSSLTDETCKAIDREVRRIWQLTERQALHGTLVRNNAQVIARFRARFGFSAARGSSNDSRLRFLAPRLLPQHAADPSPPATATLGKPNYAASSATPSAPPTSSAASALTRPRPPRPSPTSTSSNSATDSPT